MKLTKEKSNSSASFMIGLLLGFIVLIVGGPLITIWALNTLFNLGIAYNIATWFASLWISFIVMRVTTVNKN